MKEIYENLAKEQFPFVNGNYGAYLLCGYCMDKLRCYYNRRPVFHSGVLTGFINII